MATRQDLIDSRRDGHETAHRQFDRRFFAAALVLALAIMLTGFSPELAHQLGHWLAGR